MWQDLLNAEMQQLTRPVSTGSKLVSHQTYHTKYKVTHIPLQEENMSIL